MTSLARISPSGPDWSLSTTRYWGLSLAQVTQETSRFPQIGQVLKVDVDLVEYGEFAFPDVGVPLHRMLGVGISRGVGDGAARQEALQVQTQVAPNAPPCAKHG